MDAAGSGAAPTVLATIRPVRLGQNMGVLVVIVIDEEAAIAAAIKMLRAFHEQGTLTLYSMAAIARQVGVGAVLREPVGRNEAAAAPSVGAAVGTLLSVLEGPLNAATKAGGRGLIGAVRDLGDVGLDAGLLEQVSRDLNVGGGAIVAEIEESQPFALQSSCRCPESAAVPAPARRLRDRAAARPRNTVADPGARARRQALPWPGKQRGRPGDPAGARAGTGGCGAAGPDARRHAAARSGRQGERAAAAGERIGKRGAAETQPARRPDSQWARTRADRLERAAHVGMERQAGDES